MANKNDLIRLKDNDGVYRCPVTKSDGVFMSDGSTTLTTAMAVCIDETNTVAESVSDISAQISDQETRIKTWEDFKANGGEVGGDLTTKNINMPSGSLVSTTGTIQFKGNDQKQVYMCATDTRNGEGVQQCNLVLIKKDDNTGFSFRPTTEGRNYTDIGASTHKFQNGHFNGNIYVASYNRSGNGYSYLPNGMIMQWGFADFAQGFLDVAMPITFPNSCLSTFSNVALNVTQNNASNLNTMYTNSRNTSNSVIQLTLKSTVTVSDTFRVRWMAIGY